MIHSVCRDDGREKIFVTDLQDEVAGVPQSASKLSGKLGIGPAYRLVVALSLSTLSMNSPFLGLLCF